MKTKNQIQEIKVLYKRPKVSEMHKVLSSLDACELLRSVYEDGKMDFKEYFFVIMLTRRNQVLGISKVSEGGTSGTVVNSKEIFQIALKCNAVSIIICHNHPSGNLQPSEADKKLTQKIKDFSEMIDVKLLDHIIITSEGYYSFADEGVL